MLVGTKEREREAAVRDFDPMHDIMFRHLFLEERPQYLLFLLNGLLECEGENAFTRVISVDRRCEYLNNRHSCEMATILVTNAGKRPFIILIALDPHPASKKYVLPLMLKEAEKMRKRSSAAFLTARGIMLSSCAYDYLRRDKYNRNNPLYATREIEGRHLLFTEINLFRLTSPFPRRSLSRRDEIMYFLNYASIYIHAEPWYSLPLFLKGSLSAIWNTYHHDCTDERLYWRIEEYTRACIEENTRLADVISEARSTGDREARKFLRAEMEAIGIDGETIAAMATPGGPL
jgi:hypothetical protein